MKRQTSGPMRIASLSVHREGLRSTDQAVCDQATERVDIYSLRRSYSGVVMEPTERLCLVEFVHNYHIKSKIEDEESS